ncbi:HK97 family phage prohead protease [Xinfangfangia sp. D13-10-4-6]|nr:HK97 family phage prohead protease [Pseudogemmobacter hezensis]
MQTKSDAGLNKAAPVENIKALAEAGEFEGYASIFGEVDQGRDVVLSGAFRDSLIRRPAERIKMLWQHDREKIIGKWLEVREDNRGLYVKGKLILGLEKGREAHELMTAGALDGLSIGYRTVLDEYDRETETRRLKEVELREVSLVTFPMLESATVATIKSLSELKTIRDFEEALVNGTLPRLPAKDAKALLAEGFKAMRAERDAGGDGHGVAEALNALAAAFRR